MTWGSSRESGDRRARMPRVRYNRSAVMNLSPRLLISIAVLLAFACGGKTPATHIADGDESNLTDCQVLERVHGKASEGPDAETNAKNDAREKAAALGATHIRWIVPCCSSVEGDAYRCDLPED
jgi:hypothetical protein